MSLLTLALVLAPLKNSLTRLFVASVLAGATFAFAAPRLAVANAPHHHPAAHRSGHHHRGGYHRGGYRRLGGIHVNYYRGYHRTGYYRHRGYRNSQMAWMSRMYQQQYQMLVKHRQAELKAFMAAFDTNHNGVIDGKEHGPAEKYLRERRLGKIPPLTATVQGKVKR